MMSRKLVNPVTVLTTELAPGDVMAVTVTLHIIKRGDELVFRMYRCGYPPQEHEGIPQGDRIGPVNDMEVMRELFPVVGWADIGQDLL